MKHKRKFIIAVILVVGALGVAGCGKQKSGDTLDRRTTDRISRRFTTAQPVPEGSFSQLRENLREIQRSQINVTQTSTFFFARGASGTGAPVFDCPSIGYPIPSTAQLTNPSKEYRGTTIDQMEATGIYTGDSSGTYVICVNAAGKGYAVYWEGDVMTFTGPAEYDPATHQVALVGQPTVSFNTKGNK